MKRARGTVSGARLKCRTRVLMAALIAGLPAIASAHHSFAAHYDADRQVVLRGVVSRFQFVNPHAYVFFTVTAPNGEPTPWRCELAARGQLDRKSVV